MKEGYKYKCTLKQLEAARKYRNAHLRERRAYTKRWREQHWEDAKRWARENKKNTRLAALKRVGGKCVICGCLCFLHNQMDRLERIKPGTSLKFSVLWKGESE